MERFQHKASSKAADRWSAALLLGGVHERGLQYATSDGERRGAQVEPWLGQQTPLHQQQNHQQAANPTVTIQKGVDGFKLVVDQRGSDQWRDVGGGPFPIDNAYFISDNTDNLPII